MNKYWKTREIKRRQRLLDKSIADTEEEIRVVYKKIADKLIKKLDDVYKDYLLNNGRNNELMIRLYYKTLTDIEKELSKLNNKEVELLDKNMKKLYKDITNTVSDEINIRLPLDTEKVEMAVNSVWVGDGLTFHNRFSKSNQKLCAKLQELLSQMVSGSGVGPADATRELMRELDPNSSKYFKDNGELIDKFDEATRKEFEKSYKEAKRLINTELAHIEIQSTLDGYRKAGIHYYRWLSANDAVTAWNKIRPETKWKSAVCPQCLAMENNDIGYGKGIYPIDYDDFPPKHPFAGALSYL